jgi:hypothetical protein
MRILFLAIIFIGCQSSPSETKDDPLGLTGKTGRNLTINVSGVNLSKTKTGATTVCAIGLNGTEKLTKEIAEKRLVCRNTEAKSSQVSIPLTDLPYPAYITIFHDQNQNRVLDFASFDAIVVKSQGPAEGLGVLPAESEQDKFSNPTWVEVGDAKLDAKMIYGDLPFWKTVKEQSWQLFFSLYQDQAKKINGDKGDPVKATPAKKAR